MTKNLKNRIIYLPLNILSRVELWLTFKGAKPASSLSLRVKKNALNRVTKWIEDAGLFWAVDSEESDMIHVSSKKDYVEFLKLNMWSNDKADIYKKGVIYGYPKAASKAFSENPEKMIGSNHLYARYKIRVNYQKDLEAADKWQKTIRADIPKLASWFENAIKTAYNKSN